MATAAQLREIRRKAGIGEFRAKTQNAQAPNTPGLPRTRSKRRRVSKPRTEQDMRSSRFNYAGAGVLNI